MDDMGAAATLPRVLVVDDDVEVAGLVKLWLEKHDFEVAVATDGLAGLRRLYRLHPDLVILDISVSSAARLDGWELCRRIRELDDLPIIVLTAKAEMSYRVRAFDLGADDYLTKPCELGELLARIRALLRRARIRGGAPGRVFRHGDLVVDLDTHQVAIGRCPVGLSPTEFRLLAFLVQNQGQVVSHTDILSNVWGPEYRDQVAYVKLYVRYLREKIEARPSAPRLILTERGFGYRFVAAAPRLVSARTEGDAPEKPLLEPILEHAAGA